MREKVKWMRYELQLTGSNQNSFKGPGAKERKRNEQEPEGWKVPGNFKDWRAQNIFKCSQKESGGEGEAGNKGERRKS